MTDGAQTQSTGPDAADIVASEWPVRALPHVAGTRLPEYQAVVRRSVLDDVRGHGKSVPAVEVCGVLVGNVYRDESGPYLHISSSIRGDRAASRSAQVTFTAETWTAIQATMDAEHPSDRIVGWYHTHPSFGIFLSGMDLFIQDHFFNLPWQVAFVYDPVSGEEGMFLWRGGKTQRQEFLIEEDEAPRAIAPTLGETEAEQLASAPATLTAGEAGTMPSTPVPEAPRGHDPENNPWSGKRAAQSRSLRIPMWLIATIACGGSFGGTLLAMYSMQSDPVIIPRHVDRPPATTPTLPNHPTPLNHVILPANLTPTPKRGS